MPQKRAYDCQVNFKAVGEEFARSCAGALRACANVSRYVNLKAGGEECAIDFAAASEPARGPTLSLAVCEFLGEDPKKVQWFKSKRVLVGGARRLTPENASVAGGVHAGGQRP
jgi:hypothetical protein